MSAHAHLRKATANAHDRVDAAFASFDLSDARPYGAFLQRHAAAFLPAEDALTRAGAGDLIPDWEQFLRGPALIADLARMGLSVPAPKRPPDYADPAAMSRAIIENAQKEEFKHFGMDLEFILRKKPEFRETLKGILFIKGDIVEHGEEAEESVD